jgi:hypothetical protein
METLQVNILNPKAVKLLYDLADMDLISIQSKKSSFEDLLNRLQSQSDTAPSLDEITREVEIVRAERYGKITIQG